MRVTEVRIKLNASSQDRLRGFCTITLDGGFVVRDIKIIDGPNGIFVAMPARKLMDHCPQCHGRNHLRARFCNHCGAALNENRQTAAGDGRLKLYCDVAHPINAQCRLVVQDAIITAYKGEAERAKQPGYISPKLDEFGDDYDPANPATPPA